MYLDPCSSIKYANIIYQTFLIICHVSPHSPKIFFSVKFGWEIYMNCMKNCGKMYIISNKMKLSVRL